MVVSKPCVHPDCPPRDGFIRGEYESVEFIREIPRKPLKSSSTSDLSSAGGAHGTRGAINKEAMLRNAQQKSHTFPLHNDGGSDLKISEDDHVEPPSTPVSDEKESEGRRRGKTISFAGSRGRTAKGEQLDVHQGEDDEEEAETNPVEWIMITRSDPGGSVPRWMVERGTPGSIVADAGKFLDWACQKDHAHSDDEDEAVGADHKHSHADEKILRDYQTNGHLSGIDRNADDLNRPRGVQTSTSSLETTDTPGQGGMIQSLASAAYAGLETYAPKVVVEHLPGHRAETDVPSQHIEGEPLVSSSKDDDAESSISEASSVNSFASADSHLSDEGESKSVSSKTTSSQNKDNGQTVQEKELAKLNERKRKLDEKLAKTREKELKDREELTSKEQAAIKKAEEKHTKEVAKQEEKYKKEVAKLEAKKAKEAAKLAEKKKRAEDKDEKARLVREKEEVKAELDVLKKEREILKTQVGELQKENTALAAQLGKASNGRDLLKEVREEIGGKGWRSRSSSMESGGPGRIVGTRSRESTLLGKESPKSTGG